MAYIPTEWETGDVITAAKLNNMEQGIEDAFVAPAVTSADEGDVLTVNSSGEWVAAAPASQLPEVTAADQGHVLTVDSSGEWVAAAPAAQKDTLVITGDVIVDGSLNAQFTNVVGDAANIEDYKNVIVRAKVYTDLGGDDPVFSFIELIIPWYNSAYDELDPDTISSYEFKTTASFADTPIEAYLHYSPASQAWTADIVPVS